MSVTVEELQILVKANIKDALAGMSQLKTKLREVMAQSAPQMEKQAQAAVKATKQAYDAVYSEANTNAVKMNTVHKKQVKAVVDAAKVSATEVTQTQKDIEEAVKRATERLKEQSNSVNNNAKNTYRIASGKKSVLASSPESLAKLRKSLEAPVEGVKNTVDSISESFEHLDGSGSSALDVIKAKIE